MRQERGQATGMARPGQARAASVQRGPAPSRVRQTFGVVTRFGRSRPGLIVAVVAMVGCSGAIGWNALHQANRHPAPLFRPKAVANVEPPRRMEAAALPAPGPATIPVPVPRPDPTTVASVATPVPAPPPPPFIRAAASGTDPIGALIKGGDPSARPAELRPDARVASAQKALSKLGYGPLKADGVMGGTTKQALERFERDNSLPVTGGLGTRTTRGLASASGTQIE